MYFKKFGVITALTRYECLILVNQPAILSLQNKRGLKFWMCNCNQAHGALADVFTVHIGDAVFCDDCIYNFSAAELIRYIFQ